jgi:hypothetical protein
MTENVPASATWNPAVAFLIGESFRDLAVIDDEEDPTGPMYDRAAYRLNGILKTLAATGIHVWSEDEGMLFFQQRVPEYVFSGTSPAVAGTNSMVAMASLYGQWEQYQLAQSYPIGTTVVHITPLIFATAPQMAAIGDNFCVILDSGFAFWTTVAAASLGVITLAAPLPGTASTGNYCMDYPPSAQITRPLNIPRARQARYTPYGPQLTPMTRLSRQEYMDLPQPLTPGTPIQHFYSPQRGVGRLYAWSNPQDANWGARFTFYRPLSDFLVPNNTLDFPQEWIMPLRWLLSYDMGIGYSVPPEKWQIIKDERDSTMAIVAGWDREMEDVQFGLDWQLR